MSEVNVEIYHPGHLNEDEWRTLQGIARDAYASIFPDRGQEEIDALVDWDDPSRYMASHADPNTEVGGRFNANQSYSRPRVAVATVGGEPIGFGYTACNVSGATRLQRLTKRLTAPGAPGVPPIPGSPRKNYLWMREIAVRPEDQRQGVATQLGRALLMAANSRQPVTAYTWPDIDPNFIGSKLGQLGFVATGGQPVEIFGEGTGRIQQVRMQAPSVHSVLERLGNADR